MVRNLLLVFAISLMAILTSRPVSAQNSGQSAATPNARDMYLISSRAGGVNVVEGKVNVTRRDGTTTSLSSGGEVDVGDKIEAGADGKAEVLLNPGSYIRLGSNSSFEFVTTSLDDLQLKINSGSAIFEVFASNDFLVEVKTPKTSFFLAESGIYRVDVLSGGDSKITVSKGRATIPAPFATEVKGGRQATISGVSGAGTQVAKFDSDDKDSLDAWSKARAKQLSLISRKVQTASMRTALMRSFLGRRWNIYDSFGLWAFDSMYGSYCFLPFGYGWHSPYGYGFGPSIYQYNLPPIIYTGSGNPTTPTNTPLAHNPRNPDGPHPPLAIGPPPFVKIQNDATAGSSITNGGGWVVNDTRGDVKANANIDNTGGGRGEIRTYSPPVYTPPPPPPPPPPAPVIVKVGEKP